MVETARIAEVQERVRDLVKALRAANAAEHAARIDGYAAGFTDVASVRRSVASIAQQLEYWRANPKELPDLPVIHVAANRLEDACRDALRAGVIAAARPSLRAAGKRKLTVIATTLAAAALVFLIPLVVTMLGVDLTDVHVGREAGPIKVVQGEEGSVAVTVLVECEQPAATTGVEVYPEGRCEHELRDGVTCRAVAPREWGETTLPTFEVMLRDQAYGLLLAAVDTRVLGRVGNATMRVLATDDTPEGEYRVPLQAAFLGYDPGHCNLIERVLGDCRPSAIGAGKKHAGLPVPTLRVQVVRAAPGQGDAALRRKQAQQEERQRKAEQRAAQIAAALEQIDAALDETKRLLARKRWEELRQRLDKLGALFSPLDALTSDAPVDAVPIEVEEQRARLSDLRAALQAFEDRAFDTAYAVLNAPSAKGRGEDELIGEAARKLRLSAAYLAVIYADHADELEQRLAQAAQAKLDAEKAAQERLFARCGPLPTGAWQAVSGYLKAVLDDRKTILGECMTPRVSEDRCWSVTCDFQDIVVRGQHEPDLVASHRWAFVLRNGQVVGHIVESAAKRMTPRL